MTALILNMCLCNDLVKLLQSPFNVARARLKLYYALSFTTPLIMLIIITKLAYGQKYPTSLIETFKNGTKFEIDPIFQEIGDEPMQM